MNDVVHHPAHYTSGKIEVWDFIADQKLPYLLGNVIKYVSRAGKKNPDTYLEDLMKARAYLDKEIGLYALMQKEKEKDAIRSRNEKTLRDGILCGPNRFPEETS